MIHKKEMQNFLWGAATSAYQIEGGVDEDGRGPSIWDMCCSLPGYVQHGQSGRVACDHYRRWEDDLDLMAQLNLQAYRFSVAWPRVMPGGKGPSNRAGLDFYDRLVDGLLERNIEPFVTLYHWDLPLALQRGGGWAERATVQAFADYAACVAERLGDRVQSWAPINEIPCILGDLNKYNRFTSGQDLAQNVQRQIMHHLLLAQGLGAEAIRSAASMPVRVGHVHNPFVPQPFSESEEDVEQARKAFRELNGWLMDPVFFGAYPVAEWDNLGKDAPHVENGDLKKIAAPIDFFGLNIYFAMGGVARAGQGLREFEPLFPRSDMGWVITPDCLYWGLRMTHEVYAPRALYITENGYAAPHQPDERGEIEDYARVEYLKNHLRGVERARNEGLPVNGYFLWSLLDNFEWGHGYQKRFGLVYVNYETQERIPKASAEWYARMIAANAREASVSAETKEPVGR